MKWTFLVVFTLFVLLVLINWRDEPLSDEARALLETKSVEIPDRENIFVAMAGFNAPEGCDIFEYGRNKSKEIEKEFEKDPFNLKGVIKGLENSDDQKENLSWQDAAPPFDCQVGKETDFRECVYAKKESLEKALAANETLIRRYRLLQELPHYAPPVPFVGTMNVEYSQIIQTQRHLMAQAMLDIENGKAKEGLAFFKKDTAFWRRNLEGKSSLLDSMIATASLARDVYGLSLLLSSSSTVVEGQASEWWGLLTPLSHEQSSLRPAMVGEIRITYHLSPVWKESVSYQNVKDLICGLKKWSKEPCSVWDVWGGWLERNVEVLFFLPQATFNYLAPVYKTWLKLTDLPWKDYIEQRDGTLAALADLYNPGIDFIYNPVGKRQYRLVVYVWDDYVVRIHDFDTYLRMVRLQLELRLAKTPSAEIPAFIAQDKDFCSPCSDFSWNAETRMLSFQPLNSGRLSGRVPPSVYVPEPATKKP
ncbi:MAG: hypothetical protein FWF41_07775 [Betaproteobacteria bacterium]|nr:hypothetical protein [Betaproteobacteria bacterium]